MKNVIPLCLTAALLACSASAQTDPYAALAKAGPGEDCAARAAIEQQIREGGPGQYARIEASLLAVLAEADGTAQCRKFICDTLRIVGSPACVGPVAGLLKDEQAADFARLALESLPGKAVDDALAGAVKSATGRTRVGLVQTLAARRSGAVVEFAADWLGSSDPELTRAALQALGRVGGAAAVAVLAAARVAPEFGGLREAALMDAAFRLVREGGGTQAGPIFEEQFRGGRSLPAVISALNGLVESRGAAAAPVLMEALRDRRLPVALAAAKAMARVKDTSLTQRLASALPALPPPVQMAVLRALATGRDKSALPAVKAALGHAEAALRIEAVLALEPLGDASVVPDLVALSTGSGELAAAAQQTLGRLRGPGVGEAVAGLLDAPDPTTVRAAALALKARGDVSAAARLLQLAGSEQAALRAAALEALDGLAGPAEMPALLTLLGKAPEPEREKYASALWKSSRLAGTEDERFLTLWQQVAAEPGPLRTAILPLASVAGGHGPLQVVASALGSDDAALQDLAARTLSQWPNDGAVGELVSLIEKTGNPKHRILGARAVVRLVSDRNCHWEVSRKTATLERLLPLMEREEEKTMIRGALAKFSAQPQ